MDARSPILFFKQLLSPTALVAAAGLLWAARSVLDSYRLEGAIGGPILVVAALVWRVRRGRSYKLYAAAAVLALAYGISAQILIEFRADSASYFSYLRSLSFDGDFDFRNEWEALDLPPLPENVNNPRRNVFSIGPAVLWSPFYALAHVYIVFETWRCGYPHTNDGYSMPYRRAAALGTVTVVVVGAVLLGSMLAGMTRPAVAALAVMGAALASSVLYYTFYVPAMSHGVAFGVAAALLWAWSRARATPSARNWAILGGTLGVLMICRWQGAVYGALVLPLALDGLYRKTIRPAHVLAALGAGLIALTPQTLAWKIQYDQWILIPQGRGFLDFSSPNWLRTLFSADHGFFNWTPLMFLGLAGLVLGIRKNPMLFGGGVVVFLATAWVNGSVPAYDWAAGDAFGARRYTLVVPLIALGLAHALELYGAVARRAPLLVPAAAIVLLSLWNLGFIGHFRARQYPEMAPLERLSRDQAQSLRHAAQDVFGFIAGERGRAFAYDFFSAEYFYTSFNRNGRIYLRSADERYLMHGWYTPSRRIARRTFRRALYPEACVRIPLLEPFPLRITVTARAPEGVEPQTMTVRMNGHEVTSRSLTVDWSETRFLVPEGRLVPGENALCLGFDNALPEKNNRRVAAFVERVQLP